jgi:hypothetical protein
MNTPKHPMNFNADNVHVWGIASSLANLKHPNAVTSMAEHSMRVYLLAKKVQPNDVDFHWAALMCNAHLAFIGVERSDACPFCGAHDGPNYKEFRELVRSKVRAKMRVMERATFVTVSELEDLDLMNEAMELGRGWSGKGPSERVAGMNVRAEFLSAEEAEREFLFLCADVAPARDHRVEALEALKAIREKRRQALLVAA